jgi:hypothetical protein
MTLHVFSNFSDRFLWLVFLRKARLGQLAIQIASMGLLRALPFLKPRNKTSQKQGEIDLAPEPGSFYRAIKGGYQRMLS